MNATHDLSTADAVHTPFYVSFCLSRGLINCNDIRKEGKERMRYLVQNAKKAIANEMVLVSDLKFHYLDNLSGPCLMLGIFTSVSLFRLKCGDRS